MSEKIISGEKSADGADNAPSDNERFWSLVLAIGVTFAFIVAILYEPVVRIISG